MELSTLASLSPDEMTDTFRDMLSARLRLALLDAPEVIELARSMRVPRSGVGSDGVEAPLPLHAVPLDDSDDTYSALVAWAWHYAEALNLKAPVSTSAGWHIANGQLRGFSSETTAREAKVLARAVTGWLILHREQIMRQPDALTFAQAVLPALHHLRGRYPIRPRRGESDRVEVCPICGARAVVADWFSPDDPYTSSLICTGDLNGCGSETEVLLAAAGRQRGKLEALASLKNSRGDFAVPEDADDARLIAEGASAREEAASETCDRCGHPALLHDRTVHPSQGQGGCHATGCPCTWTS